MAKKEKQNKEPMFRVKQLRPPKLKDVPEHRSRVVMNLRDQFGFMPEIMIIDKVKGSSGRIIISAVLPKEMADKIEAEEKEKASEDASSNAPEGAKKNI